MPGGGALPGSEIVDASARVVASTATSVVVALEWRFASSPEVNRLFQVLRLSGGSVVDMQDHTSQSTANRAAGVRA